MQSNIVCACRSLCVTLYQLTITWCLHFTTRCTTGCVVYAHFCTLQPSASICLLHRCYSLLLLSFADNQVMQSMPGVVTDVDVSSGNVAEEVVSYRSTAIYSNLYKHTRLRNNRSPSFDVLNSRDRSESWDLLPVQSDEWPCTRRDKRACWQNLRSNNQYVSIWSVYSAGLQDNHTIRNIALLLVSIHASTLNGETIPNVRHWIAYRPDVLMCRYETAQFTLPSLSARKLSYRWITARCVV